MSTNTVNDVGAAPTGQLFALTPTNVVAFDPWSGSQIPWAPISGGSRMDVSGGGLVVASSFAAGWRVRRFAPTGAPVGERIFEFALPGDAITGLSIDALGGVAVGLRRNNTQGLVGRLEAVQ